MVGRSLMTRITLHGDEMTRGVCTAVSVSLTNTEQMNVYTLQRSTASILDHCETMQSPVNRLTGLFPYGQPVRKNERS